MDLVVLIKVHIELSMETLKKFYVIICLHINYRQRGLQKSRRIMQLYKREKNSLKESNPSNLVEKSYKVDVAVDGKYLRKALLNKIVLIKIIL